MNGRSSCPMIRKLSNVHVLVNSGFVTGTSWRGGQEGPSNFFRNRQMIRNFTVSLKNSRIFLLVQIKFLNLLENL